MCIFSSCCCGWQTLQQGLFIFGLFDLFIRFFMTALETYSGASTLGFEALLFLADVALAVGAKLEVRFLLLVYLVIFGIQIAISVILPPAMILIGWIFTEHVDSINDNNIYTHLLSYVTNVRGLTHSRILYLVYHGITWFLGWMYLYIWMCARSLFIRISPLSSIHILPGEYNDDKYSNTRF